MSMFDTCDKCGADIKGKGYHFDHMTVTCWPCMGEEEPGPVAVTIRGETREVPIVMTQVNAHRYYRSVEPVAVFQKRPGGKLWQAQLRFYCDEKRGGQLTPCTTETFLNRAGYRLVAWNDAKVEKARSRHNTLGQ